MATSKSTSKIRISFPSCVAEAVTAADQLYDYVIAQPFPDLDVVRSCAEEGAPILREALEWAKAIDEKHKEVLKLFPPRETGVEVRVEPPPVTRMMGMRGPDGRMVPRFDYKDVAPAQGAVTRRPVSLFVASDVLEPIPVRYEDTLASDFPLAPKDWSKLPGEDLIREHIRGIWDHPDGWYAFASRLHGAMVVVRSKSLGLVGWIRERAAEIQRATWPEISWESTRGHGGQIVRVSMAGASRRVDLTGGEHDFLAGLACGPAECYRKDKSSLTRKIPELEPFVVSIETASETRTRYCVSADIAERIDVNPKA